VIGQRLCFSLLYSNCQGSLILDVLRYVKYEPQVLQVELHPYLAQDALVQLCNTLGIAVTAYSSFGPQSYLELGMGKDSASLLDHNVVGSIASAHGKSLCSF
jgi:D-xylose reductase